jgi:translation elongation factor EF-G
MHANKQNQIDKLQAGDIGAVVGFKDIKTGDTLCEEKSKVVLESMVFPEPVIGYAIEPKKQVDVDKLGMAIAKLVEEDPTLRVNTDQETGQTILRGMGELHLEIIIDRLRREFKVEINQGAPQVAYKESLTTTNDHKEVYKKQTGGRGKFADIVFKIGPRDDVADCAGRPGVASLGGHLTVGHDMTARQGSQHDDDVAGEAVAAHCSSESRATHVMLPCPHGRRAPRRACRTRRSCRQRAVSHVPTTGDAGRGPHVRFVGGGAVGHPVSTQSKPARSHAEPGQR